MMTFASTNKKCARREREESGHLKKINNNNNTWKDITIN